MTVLRTPDERFSNLPGYGFPPNYVSDLPGYDGLRMHYVDAGPADAETVFLCLHGQPTWSYLYRRMIPVFTAAGCRSVAPDMFGFGRSDKPSEDATYTFTFHRESLMRLVEHLDLKNITLVCQDWGGLLGLTMPMDMPGRFTRLLVMNTGFAAGDVPLGDGFLAWREWNNKNPDMDVARLIGRTTPHLSEDEQAAYGAPYPDMTYKGGVRRFPNMVPDNPDADGAALSRRARDWWGSDWTGQSFMAIGMQDPVIPPKAMMYMQKRIRGCPEPLQVADAGHFVQEWGGPVAEAALDAFGLR